LHGEQISCIRSRTEGKHSKETVFRKVNETAKSLSHRNPINMKPCSALTGIEATDGELTGPIPSKEGAGRGSAQSQLTKQSKICEGSREEVWLATRRGNNQAWAIGEDEEPRVHGEEE
jgi:hypothetical protein